MKKITLGVFVFSVIAFLGISLATAFPFGFVKMNQNLSDEEQNEINAFHDSLQTAIENEDYESWKTLMESQLTEENFNKMIGENKEMQTMKAEMEEKRAQFCEENDCSDFEEGQEGLPNHFRGHPGMMMNDRISFKLDSE
jgi:hypothetical protein